MHKGLGTSKSSSPDELRRDRVGNAVRNSAASFVLTFVTTIMPFILRTLMVNLLGEKYVGLNSVLQSIVWVLNISEMGIGSVIVFFLYEPVAKGDIRRVNAYLAEFRKLYAAVAVLILVTGTMVFPFLPRLVVGEIPAGENIYLLYALYLLTIVLQYLLWPEILSVFAAFQRMDIHDLISLVCNIASYLVQILAICVWKSFVIYVAVLFVQTIAACILQKLAVNRYFPECRPEGAITQRERGEIRRKIASMFGHQLDEKVLGNVDNLYISSILGLNAVAVYGNYFFVVMAVSRLLNNTFHRAGLSSMGNALVVESRESNMGRFHCLLFLDNILGGWSVACTLCMYQTFMGLWMPGKLLPFRTVILFCVWLYAMQMRRGVQTMKNAAGMWNNDKFKPYVAVIADLILDAILIRIMGLEGAILATLICVGLIELPWEVYVLYKDYLGVERWDYYGRFFLYLGYNAVLCILTYGLIQLLQVPEGVVALVVQFAVCTVVSMVYYGLIYRKHEEAVIWMNTIVNVISSARRRH